MPSSPKSLFHIEIKGHSCYIHGTGLASLTECLAMEYQLSRSGTFGYEAPDTGINALRGIASRALELQNTLRGCRSGPFVAKWELYLDDIAIMDRDRLVDLRRFDDDVSTAWYNFHHSITGAAIGGSSTGNRSCGSAAARRA